LSKNWASDQLANDYGPDRKVDLFDGEKATRLELLVQLKLAPAPDVGDSESIRLKTTTFNYLKDKLQVVMLVKFVESEQETYWLLLRNVNAPPDENQETMTVRLPRENRLSAIDWSEIQTYIQTVTDKKLAAARAWQQQQARDRASK
jgi:hypothetical protein